MVRYRFSLKVVIFSSLFKVLLCQETTTEMRQFQNDSCPPDFTPFADKCYTLDTACPYHLPLPFDAVTDINVTTFKLQIAKDTTYDYYKWYEILGNYGKLFTSPLASYNSSEDYIIVEHNTTDITFSTTGENATFMCAYDSPLTQPDTTYCQLYDKICSNNTRLNSTNCHCMNATGAHFCELSCANDTIYNETVCGFCEEILAAYEDPAISLQVNYQQGFIFVSIDSYLKLLPVNSSSNAIVYCFTDANNSKYDVTYRYDVSTNFTVYNNSYSDLHYNIDPLENLIGHYWCEGFSFKQSNISTVGGGSTIIAQSGNRESFTMNITVEDDQDTYPLTIHEKTRHFIWRRIRRNKTIDTIDNVYFLQLYEKIPNDTSTSRKIGYRLYLNKSSKSDMTDALNLVKNTFQNHTVSVSPSYCLPSTTTQPDNTTLTWDKTLLGMTTIPNELCLQNDSKPVTRKCLGEYLYGTFWSGVDGTCVNNSGHLYGSQHTTNLHNLTHSAQNDKIDQLQDVLTTGGTLISVDVHFMAQIFENVTLTNQTLNLTTLQALTQTASQFMDVNRTVLRGAQTLLNSTDMMVYNLARIMSNCSYDWTEDYYHIVTKNIFVQVSKMSKNITGVAVYETGNNVTLQALDSGTNLDELDRSDLKLVAFITGTQVQQVVRLNDTDAKLVITVYRQSALFNVDTNPTSTGFLVGLYVSGFEEPFMYDYVRVLIKPDRKYRADLYCNFWQYGRDKLWRNRFGYWISQLTATPSGDLQSCRFWSMRNYAILLGRESDVVLSIVTVVGCALSMFGSLAVIVTGIIYKNWREKSGTKILLNFVVTNFIQNIFLAVSSKVDSFKNPDLCKAIGACLHYCVLSQFVWMMIIGYLQYLRYVKIFYIVNNCFVIATSIAAWMVPLIPVVTVLALDSSFYVQDEFCYLQNNPLLYGVFLPVALTLIANGAIFAAIFINVYCKNYMTTPRDAMSWLNLRLVILLFFLLGLYWVFGICARFTNLTAFDYFFCISAGLQGVVVFFYFIVFNKMTRNFWMRQLKLSEMLSAMQIWLQQKKKLGKIRIDKTRSDAKVKILKSLDRSTSERLKLT